MSHSNKFSKDEIYSKLFNLYKYRLKFEIKLKKSLQSQIFTEYYFIDLDWLEKFKEMYNYKEFVIELKKYAEKFKVDLNNYKDDELKDLRPFLNFSKLKTDNNGLLKKINNKKILGSNYQFGDSYQCFFSNFAILDKNIYNKLTQGYITELNPKTDALVGQGLVLLKLHKNVFEIVFIEKYYELKEIFILCYNNEDSAIKGVEDIQKNGFENYCEMYKIDLQNIGKQGQKIKSLGLTILSMSNIEKKPKTIIPYRINSLEKFRENNEKNEKENKQFSSTVDKSKIGLDNQSMIKLKNNGGYSSINAVLHCFISINEVKKNLEIFNEYFKNNKNKYMISTALSNLIINLNLGNNDPLEFQTIIDFIDPNLKNDVKNFTDVLIETLRQENSILNENSINKYNNNLNDFRINENKEKMYDSFKKAYDPSYFSQFCYSFYWIKQIKTTCYNCKKSKFIYESNNHINFHLNASNSMYIHIKNCFYDYQKEKKAYNQPCCPFCNNIIYLKESIYEPPKNLIIFLIKNNNNFRFDYDEIIDISNFVELSNGQPKKYKLFGVISLDFVQNKINEKKYVSYFKNDDLKSKWLKYEDDNGTCLKKCQNKEYLNNQLAEILIYKDITN